MQDRYLVWRKLGLSLSMLCLGGAALAQSAPNKSPGYQLAQTQSQEFNIPPQPLESALDAFRRATGLQLNYPPELTQGKSTSGVSSAYTPEQALDRLLAGSGLEGRGWMAGPIRCAKC